MSESTSGAVAASAVDEDDADLAVETIAVLGAAGELYGVTAEKVSEIVRLQQITEVPNALDLVEGVINLRGLIVPIVDLRRHLGLPIADLTSRSRIVIVELQGADVPISVGLVVDSVEEVRIIDATMVDNETALIILLDMDAIFEDTVSPN